MRKNRNQCFVIVLFFLLLILISMMQAVYVDASVPGNSGAAVTAASDYLNVGNCGTNLTYVLDGNGCLSITGEGDMTNYADVSAVPWFSYRSLITKVSFRGNITSIGAYAFDYCVNLNSITIPESIINIGAYSFYGCSGLSSISIPKNVTEIGAYAFCGCTGLASVDISDNVTSIGENAFVGTGVDASEIAFRRGSCGTSLKWELLGKRQLRIYGTGAMTDFSAGSAPWYDEREKIKELILSDGVTGIGDYAFEGCKELNTVTLANTVTSIGKNAFTQCTGVSEIDLGGITEIAEHAFEKSGLTEVRISGSGTVSIGNDAFSGCASLKKVTLEQCILKTGDRIWQGCTGLESVAVSAGFAEMGSSLFADCTSLSHVSLTGDCSEIGSYQFSGCTALTEIIIPEGTAELGSYAFRNCTGMTEIILPDSVVSIQEGAFSGCRRLKTIQFSKHLETIGNNAFQNCVEFTYLTIPDSVTSMGSGVFSGCSKLESLTLPFVGSGKEPETASQETLFGYVFGTVSYSEALAVKQYYSDGGYSTFYLPESLVSVTITGGRLLYGAFGYCANLERITIPDTITSIGPYVFRDCKGLGDFVIANGVTELGSYAFLNCTGITEITLPDSLTAIRTGAFSGCTALETVELPQNISQIADNTFQGCSALQEIRMPDQIESIGAKAFCDCAAIINISLPANLTELGDGAFRGCVELQRMNLPAKISYIPDEAFFGCAALQQIDMAGNVTSIGDYAFAKCTRLKMETVPETVTEIGSYAFGDCVGFTNMEIPKSITAIGAAAFSGCSALKSLSLPFVGGAADAESASASTVFGYIFGTASYKGSTAARQFYSGNGSATYYIPNALTEVEIAGGKIWYGSFSGCSHLESIRFLSVETVTDIGAKAFQGCAKLTHLTFPNGVETIGDYAFSGCTALENLPKINNVETIGSYAFHNCSSLKSVSLPETVTAIHTAAFSGCSSLESLTLPFVGFSRSELAASEKSLFGYIFGRSSYAGSAVTKQYYSQSGYQTYYLPESLKTVTVTGGRILYGAFYNCTGIASLSIPDNLAEIGDYALYHCAGIAELTLSKDLTKIGDYAFAGCSGLTHLALPENLTEVGKYTFYQCSGLKEISLPFGVTSIGSYAFSGCSGLKEFAFPPKASSIESFTFAGCTSMEQVTITQGITEIGAGAFQNCRNLTHIIVPDSVTTMNAAVFSGCSSLESLTLPFVGYSGSELTASEKSLFGYVFGMAGYTGSVATKQYYTGSSYKTYYIPASLKDVTITGGNKLLYGTFYGCSGLNRITLPETITGIGQNAFYQCTALSEITIPKNVTSLEAYAFAGCTGMKYVTFSGKAPTIAATAFTGVTAMVFYPLSDTTWHDAVGKQYGGKLTWQSHTHIYQPVVTAPSCTEQGYTTYQCSLCNSSYISDYVNALGHISVVDPAVQATCTGTGLTEGSHCSVCGDVIIAQVSTQKMGHQFTEYVSNKDASYEQDGTMTAKCNRCQTTETITDPGSKLEDKNKPEIQITVGTNHWTEFFHSITFGLFFKDSQTVEIKAEDEEKLLDGSMVSRLDSVYYYISDTEIKLEDLEQAAWKKYTNAFTLDADKKYIVYAKAVDQSKNTTYASSAGMIVDHTAPVMDGISDGQTYCKKAVFTVKDLSLRSVTDNGAAIEASDGLYTISGDDKTHRIIATDDCGNTVEAAIVVTEHHMWQEPAFSWSDSHKSCTADYTCSRDGSHAEQIKCTVQVLSSDAACTKAGHVLYKATSVLDGVEKTDLQSVSAAALGHDYAPEFVWAADYSACTVTLTCQRAGCDKDDEGHLLDSLPCMVQTKTTAATCISQGKREVAASLAAEGVEYTDICSTEAIPVDPDNHVHTQIFNRREATCLMEGATGDIYCLDCNKLLEKSTATEPLAHVWDDGQITKAASCSGTGILLHTCTNGCGTVREEEIPADTAHHGELYIVGAKEATEAETGYTGDTYCSDCKQMVAQGTIIPAAGDIGGTEKPSPTPGSSGTESPSQTPGSSGTEGPSQAPGSSGAEKPPQTPGSSQTIGNSETPTVPDIGKTLTNGTGKYIVTTKGKAVSYAGPVQKKADSVTIPATVTIDGIKYNVTAVANKALRKNTYVKKVIIGKNVTSIGTSAFSGCTRLKKVTFQNGSALKTIGSSSFDGCKSLTKITISSTKLTTIKKKAFNGCRRLKNVIIASKKLKTVEKNAFKGIKSSAKIKVPSSKVKSYKKKFAKAGLGKKVKITK